MKKLILLLILLTGCFETSKQTSDKKYEDRVIDWFKQKDEKVVLFKAGIPTKTLNVSNTEKLFEYYFEEGEKIEHTETTINGVKNYKTTKQFCSVTFFLKDNLIVDGKYKGNICSKLMSSWRNN